MTVDLCRGLARDVFTVKVDRACCRLVHACEHIEHGRFSCAVRTDKTVKLILFYRKIKVVNSLKTAELDRKIFYFEHRCCFTHFDSPPTAFTLFFVLNLSNTGSALIFSKRSLK